MFENLTEAATFVRVVETGSFSAAARALEVPKSTISRRVSRLEERLGVQLLVRTSRAMRPTAAGELFHSVAADGLRSMSDAFTAVREQAELPSGRLRISGPPDLAPVLSAHIADFTRAHPGVFVSVELSTRRVDLVGEGFDAAIRAGKLQDSTLIGRHLADATTFLVASPTYLGERGRPQSPQELAKHDCLLFRAPRGTARWTLRGPGGDEFVDVRGPTSGEGLAYLLGAAIAGMGIARLPHFTTASELESTRLERVLPEWTTTYGALYLVYPPSRHLPARLRAFRDFTLAHLPGRLYAG